MIEFLSLVLFVLAVVIGVVFHPLGASASMVGIIGVFIVFIWLRNYSSQNKESQEFRESNKTYVFLTSIFMLGLLLRVGLGLIIFGLDLQGKTGPDALFYDSLGDKLSAYWLGTGESVRVRTVTSGWGMGYFVAAIYYVIGKNPLGAQIIISVFGATSALIGYLCTNELFRNKRVAEYTAIYIAVFPSMILWTSQLLKDGLIIFLLLVIFLGVLRLYKQFNYFWAFILVLSLVILSSLRFYVFLIVVAATVGGMVLNAGGSAHNLAKRFVFCVVIGVIFSYLGVWSLSQKQVERFGSLETVQLSREWASKSAGSGFLGDPDSVDDVRTTAGLLSAIPNGLAILYLAPFPWQVRTLTQAATMPEMIIWWLSLPLIFTGIWYSVKHRFQETISILFFAIILSLSYSLYQGNLGTLYRQRTQIQVFLLMFAAVGTVIRLEKKENKTAQNKKRRLLA